MTKQRRVRLEDQLSEYSFDKKSYGRSSTLGGQSQVAKLIDQVEIKQLVKGFKVSKLSRAEVNRLTTYVMPDTKECTNMTYEDKPVLNVTQVKVSMREVNLFLFKQYEVLPFKQILNNFVEVFNSCFTVEKPYAMHKYSLNEI